VDNYVEYPKIDTIEALKDQERCGEVTGVAARMAAEIMLQPRASFQDKIDSLAREVQESRKLYKIKKRNG
jgi:hypothetical protein